MAEEMTFTPVADMGAKSVSDFINADDATFKASLGMKFETKAEPAVEVAPPVATSEPAQPAQPVASEPPAQDGSKQPEATPPEEPKPLLTKFQVFDEQGELDAADTAKRLKFALKANGKEYSDVPLDKVVLLAQMGFANQEREQQVLASKQFVSEAHDQLGQAADVISRQNAEIERLLLDPGYADIARDKFAQENSPARRAERAENTLRQREAEFHLAQADQARKQFVGEALYPTLVHELNSAQGAVSEAEVIGQFTLLTAPLMVRGAVPPERLGEVHRLVQQELVPWIRNQSALKALDRQHSVRTEQAKVMQAKEQTALAKRQLARTVAPTLNSATPQTVVKSKSYKSAADWLGDLDGLVSSQNPS